MFAGWRKLAGEQKLKLVSEQCQALHRVSLAGLAARYPEASSEELEMRAGYLRVGRPLAERLTGVVMRW
jgi:hypothetical protein